MDSPRKSLTEVCYPGVGYDWFWRSSQSKSFRMSCVCWLRSWPVCHLLYAVLDAEGSEGSANLYAPPPAKAEGRIASCAEQVPGAIVDKPYVYAIHRDHKITGFLPVTRPPQERLNMCYVAAEVPHNTERMGEKGFHMEVWISLDSRRG